MKKIELIDKLNDKDPELLTFSKIDGFYRNKLYDHMLTNMDKNTVDSIFSNGYQALKYFANPLVSNNLSKILCLGKVQSGKTAFFITDIALAFDNGYDIVYLIGGTKNKLRDQNLKRVKNEFENNENVLVVDLNSINFDIVDKAIKDNKKIILVVLKNASTNTNLGLLYELVKRYNNIPSLVIDDEGDEFTPGAPKLKYKNPNAGKTHDVLSDIILALNCCTFMSVTATPQANLLLSTFDEVSPDYVVLVKPGKGYMGGNAFHDTMDNPHTVEIDDNDDFKDSVPNSFKDALYFYIFACCLERAKNNYKPYSMLVHPSSLTIVHSMVSSKINDLLIDIKNGLSDKKYISYLDYINEIRNQYDKYISNNPDCDVTFENIQFELYNVLNNISLYEFNVSKNGTIALKEEKDDDSLYKIYVGGNMLGRGLTIPNLIVTYMYRDSKETAIDTLYQRARWFGYKAKYFDICKVYMTKKLKEKFIATVESENDMWNAINSFLLTNTKIKYFPRIFSLNNDKLILTRKSVSKTITFSRINPGYTYDKSVWYGNSTMEMHKGRKYNREIFEKFFSIWFTYGKPKQFGINPVQTHYIIEMKFTELYRDFLEKYQFPIGSKFGLLGFNKILKNVQDGIIEDKISVVVMRYRDYEYRALCANDLAIKELPQGRNDNSAYTGDKCLENLMDKFHLQIHLVYHDKENKSDYVPMLALNNPITSNNVRYVTGDNDYETI